MTQHNTEKNNLMLCLFLLGGSYLLLAFPLFQLHGMKDWPKIMALVGFIVILLAALSRKKWTVLGATLGYPLGFFLAYLFKSQRIHPLRGNESNLWYLWMLIDLGCILLGLSLDLYLKKKRKKG